MPEARIENPRVGGSIPPLGHETPKPVAWPGPGDAQCAQTGATLKNTTFVVGITGHRDVDSSQLSDAHAAVTGFLTTLRKYLPDTEIILMSGLADGADRIAVRVALELDMLVHAVLPMEQSDYESDFSPKSAEEFQALLATTGVDVTELATVRIGDEIDRDACYRQLTDCLIRKSNILLALWDGVDSGLTGGTSDTVLSFLAGPAVPSAGAGSLEFVNEAPVAGTGRDFAYWIPVPRSSSKSPARAAQYGKGVFLSAVPDTGVVVIEESMPVSLQEQLEQLNEFNADFKALRNSQSTSLTWGLPDISDASRSADSEGLLGSIEQEFDKADALALHYQSKSDRLFKGFSLVAAMLGLLFLTYAKLVASNVFLYAYVVLFTGGFLVFKLAARRHWFAKHITYRVVAETLRIKFFLRLAGADGQVNVSRISRLAGIDKFSGFSWIKHVFKGAEPVSMPPVASTSKGDGLSEARKLWVDDQSQYFAKKIHSMHRRHHRVERIKSGLLLATLAGIAALIIFKYPLYAEIPGTDIQYKKLVVFFMGLFPFWLGVWEIYHNKMATKELLWQYRNQAAAFALSEFQLSKATEIERQRTIIADLATGALFENYLWTIQRFHREHEPPAAG